MLRNKILARVNTKDSPKVVLIADDMPKDLFNKQCSKLRNGLNYLPMHCHFLLAINACGGFEPFLPPQIEVVRLITNSIASYIHYLTYWHWIMYVKGSACMRCLPKAGDLRNLINKTVYIC